MKKAKLITLLVMHLTMISLKAQEENTSKKEELTWYTDIVKASEISNSSQKPLFAFFTGSDWCGWCKKLQNDVFSKPDFIKWAKTNVVLVELDFPRGKALSPELTQQNQSLQQTFQVRGYPTIWMFFLVKNKENTGYNIESLGSLGYPEGAMPGKEEIKFLGNANSILAKKSTK